MNHLVPMGFLAVAITFTALAAPGGDRGWSNSGGSSVPWANDLSNLKRPVRVDVGRQGELIVSDHAWQRVLTLRQDNLGIVDSFSVRGTPGGLAFHDDKVYVGNDSTSTVSVYSIDGRLLYEFAKRVEQPRDIALCAEQELVLVVSGRTRTVEVFSLDGNHVRTIPSPGEEVLANPTGVAIRRPQFNEDVDRSGVVGMQDLMAMLGSWGRRGGPADVNLDGRVDIADLSRVLSKWNQSSPPPELLVSDFGDPDPDSPIDPAIRIYDLQGVHLQTISGAGRFSRPQGLQTNHAGQVLLADSMLCRILVIDPATDEIVRTIGELGTDAGQLKLPLDLVIDPESGDLFVTNSQLGRIEAYREGGR